MKAQFNQLQDNVVRGFYDPTDKEYVRSMNLLKYNITQVLHGIPDKVELYAQVRNLDTYQFDISTEKVSLEKVIGSLDNLFTVNWLERAMNVSKAVCRVVVDEAKNKYGTGFLIQGGYLITNNHVIGTPEEAAGARIEFNYERDLNGLYKATSQYKLDASDFKTSPIKDFDCTRIKVIDGGDNPLSSWGVLEMDSGYKPEEGEGVSIIQHPDGGDKRIALRANEVIGQQDQYLYYTTDTKGGSSGSPVLNKELKVVALHHAGRDFKGKAANEGILISKVLEFFNQ
ncbi:MAG: trypsin-like peptidase domain-containing protein [Saprospiraceae bacterium]|nr:trypsin-like peptidase domain-containing protein [Saprospiraceae bacterium]